MQNLNNTKQNVKKLKCRKFLILSNAALVTHSKRNLMLIQDELSKIQTDFYLFLHMQIIMGISLKSSSTYSIKKISFTGEMIILLFTFACRMLLSGTQMSNNYFLVFR